MITYSKTGDMLRGPVLAMALAGLAAPAVQAGEPDCGQPVVSRACDVTAGGAGCGILYLHIANVVEDGPVLHGLSLSPSAQHESRGPAQCAGAVSGALPPADPGSPDRDCVAYLLPACTYGLQARFGDGSRSSTEGIRIGPQQHAAAAGQPACATVTLDLGRQQLTSDVLESCDQGHRLNANLTAADPAAPGLDQGGDGGLADRGVTMITVSGLQDGNRKGSGVLSE